MTKKNIFNLVIAMCIASFAGAQCLSNPTADLIGPNGMPDGNGNCPYSLEICVTVIENDVNLIEFRAGSVSGELDAGNGNTTFPVDGIPLCITLNLTLDCLNPSILAIVEGFDNPGGGNGGSCFVESGVV
ncbi:MAG: hypothetical protein AB8F74_00965, partial [Saprospiraceae bacterium]